MSEHTLDIANLLNNTKEQEIVPDGEYDLEVYQCREQRNKADTHNMYVFVINIKGAPVDVPEPVYDYFTLPNAADDEDRQKMLIRRLKRVLECLGINFSKGFSPEMAQGATGRARVISNTGDDGETRNRIIWPKYSNEPEQNRDRRRR